ncbi:methyl-accepting chemotaxis protein [Aquabacterium sp.]|uniref:methyl-accepting chemotaxis protein n=1 Tax=Aquabacterium sp. TaxID=1872578 RepID=UPI002E373701|nr:methyl-accepting chemotaxis protein [Aquabacterium sp.]HEX5312675.1 methyl-accepting chemotaxis protein [Aquabacterium sp.]
MNFSRIMRGFTIQTRMYSAIGVVLSLLVLVGGVGVVGMRVNHQTVAVWQEAATEAQTMATLHAAVGQMRMHEKDMVLNAGHAAQVDTSHKLWQADVARIQSIAAKMLEGEEDEDNPLVKSAMAQLDEYRQGVSALSGQLAQSDITIQDAASRMAPFAKLANKFDEQLEGVDKIVSQELQTSAQAEANNLNATMAWFVASVVLAIAVVAPTTILNQVSICRPIEQARQMALGIARGDLGQRVEVIGEDEPAELLAALNDMQESLKAIVGEVRRSAESISIASTEIASGNMDLSNRTESTASSLQETASSMHQLTETVQQSADSASQANVLASGAATAAERGNAIVSEVVANMGEIDSTSKRINDIISVIDGIAFQTNILALNAAVEAARAGEQGRGFAVVAGEVRSLAQRSASAAKEIKQLILASGEKVESGTRLVHDAGAAMQEILSSVQRVSDIIGEITSASNEQSHGINQVNQAVTSLDQMTQQNAALVEQSAAAAASLKEQAGKLTQSMAVFRV